MPKISYGSLSVKDRERLVRLCGLFSSNSPGQCAAAAAKADQLIRERGLTWADVIGAPPVAAEPSTTSQLIAEALAFRHELSEIEVQFLHNAAGFAKLSPKQQDWLDRILTKVRIMQEAA
jgi:hypothetical protein